MIDERIDFEIEAGNRRAEVDRERGRLKVVFEIFGRETVTDLNFDQVEKI